VTKKELKALTERVDEHEQKMGNGELVILRKMLANKPQFVLNYLDGWKDRNNRKVLKGSDKG